VIAQALRKSGAVVVLTGAGISAESGIPTFRGEEGYWTVGSRHYQPSELATRQAFSQMPEEIWSWYLYRRAVCRAAQPNAGHQALLQMSQLLGERFWLVTQNVDGLHLRVGHDPKRTFEIHGNIDYYRCWEDCCPDRHRLPEEWLDFQRQQKLTSDQLKGLKCPSCGALARPHVLWFDECYDEETYRLESSRLVARKASLLVSVGTSGATNLPLQMRTLALSAGAHLVDINPEVNPFSDTAHQWMRCSASEGLQRVLEAVKKS
jgi:NAD-dependent deacetylase